MSTKVDIKNIDYSTEVDGGSTPFTRMHILGRVDGSRDTVHITNEEVQPYFCIKTEEFDDELKEDDKVVDWEHGEESIYGDEMTRIYTRIPADVPKLRGEYEHYEADILMPNRFMIDTGIMDGVTVPEDHAHDTPTEVSLSDMDRTEADGESRIFFCDIEVDDDGGFPDEGKADKEIVSISLYDNYTEEYHVYFYHPDNPDLSHDNAEVHLYTNEADMMNAFAEHLRESWPDILAGWNFKDFDARYLVNRMDNLSGLSSDDLSPLGTAFDDGSYKGGKIRGISVFDMLKAYKNLQYTELDSFSLENVAQDVLGYGKIEDNRKICEQWDEDPQLLLDYNVQDVKLTVDLEEKEDIIKFNEEKADFAGGRIAEVIDPSQAVDMYILHVVHEAGYVLPSSATVKSGEDFEGGQVFDPSTGIKEMVEVLDLASLYPMSMKTLNAGPTTKDSDGDITAPNGVSFTTEKDSIISEIIDDLLEERQAKKDLRDQHAPGTAEHEKYDRQQRAVKVIMNTLYGVMGWDRFRLYDKDVGAAVTAVGRECIIFTQELVEEMGYDVIYGDTDSVMVELGGDVSFKEAVQIGLELEDEINSKYDDFAKGELGVDEHWFEMEFEKLYRRFFQAGKKKRYAGHVIWDEGDQVDKVGIVGLEYKRSDYSTVAREIQKEIVSLIVRGASFDEISNVLQQEVKKIQNRYYDWDDLGIPGGISKAFDDYKSKTLTVKGAEYANKHLGAMIQSGDKPKGIYIEKAHSDELPSPDMKTPYVCWMDEGTIDSVVPEELSIDWEKYLQAQIEGPLSRIFEGTDWDYDGMLTGQLQGDMFEYSNDDNSEDGMFEDVDISDTSSQDTSNNEENGQNQYENSDPVLEEQDDEQKVQTGLGDF